MVWSEGDTVSFPSFDPASGTVSPAGIECVAIEDAVLLGDTVSATVLDISYMGTVTRVWVHDGQIIRELDEGLGMELSRVPPGQEAMSPVPATSTTSSPYPPPR